MPSTRDDRFRSVGVDPRTLEGTSLEQATVRYFTHDDTACQSAPSMQRAQQERK
jgi:hypothetical protein